MKSDRLKSILGIPYLLFLTIVVVFPVLILLYYAFTNGAGEFSLANFTMELDNFLWTILFCFLQTVRQLEP